MAAWESLKKRKDFVRLSQAEHKFITPGIVVLMMTQDEPQTKIRVGYTVTKKIGKATVRNSIKRKFRALTECAISEYGCKSCDYVLIARYKATTMCFHQLEKDFKRACKWLEKKQLKDT